jgi:hypothetical protein
MVDGTLGHQADGQAELICTEEAAQLSAGAKVLLTIAGEAEKRTGTITALTPAAGGGFRVDFADHERHTSDKRDFPRLHAGLPIAYRQADSGQAAAWLAGEPISGEWTEPDPYMNFSVGGLRFDAQHELEAGHLLLIKLQVGDDGPVWRTSARVVRVFEVAADSDARCSVAVSFEVLPSEARDALSDLTLQIQETLL